MNEEDARKLLDEYYEARRGQVDCPEWTKPGELSKYRIAEKACIDAMTHAETIAEQRREIERLTAFVESYEKEMRAQKDPPR